MRTFLAVFALLEVSLAKAIGIFLEKQPLPGDHDANLKKFLSKNLHAWGCEHFWRVFALLEVLWQKP